MSDDVLVARPRKVRKVCFAFAAVIVVLFAVLGVALAGGSAGSNRSGNAGTRPGVEIETADRIGIFVFGVAVAGLVLIFTRPRMTADATGVHVRNLLRSAYVTWPVVEAVRFGPSSSWAILVLRDDDTLPVMAVQANDGDYARETVAELRRLHAAARG